MAERWIRSRLYTLDARRNNLKLATGGSRFKACNEY
eukprot:CAMPEP_0203964470 /NCGR_PEP_ID=MMETSP0359-20131031/94209_1 /ASSEMBLY_ACC=CAM_ASM_000338 /TAXON_ID=268821 /ORGANISM="Scrippsiella Hangoei, Strain SHTV-5" /LENGTH=35 /DNA_ID= /DNA_START= /DNA_END= /DNA_ORIENTATION=